KNFPGTSAAAPHVSGVIALMYSVPCSELLSGIGVDPMIPADRVLDALYSSVTPNTSLANITVTGGRLQADAALSAAMQECETNGTESVDIWKFTPNPV